jgi:acylphosphatase
MAVKRIHCHISGRVQGVFYRAHAKEWARQNNLTGWVRNKADGSVELMAEGEEKDLKALVEKLKQGPPSGKVDDCHVHWEPASGKFNAFNVRFR